MIYKLKGLAQPLRDFLYGMTHYEIEELVKRQKIQKEHLIMLCVFGDLLGLPLSNRYYALRLFPYFLPKIKGWKRKLLRERDLTDMEGMEL